MNRTSLTTAQQSLLEVLQQSPQGLRLGAIEQALTLAAPNRRTLQRWLRHLAEAGLVQRQARGRASRYVAITPTVPIAPEPTPSMPLVPLSQAGQWVAAQVAQPVQKRVPVGYQRAFLDNYRPNESFFLPLELRQKLLAQGQAVASSEPAGTYARQIAHRLLIDLSWNSSRLEGNTYSLLETERLLLAGESAEGKDALDAQMILNHKDAIEFLIESASEIGFNRYTVLNLHALLSDNLLQDPTASGRLRRIAVGIGHTVFLPLEGPQRIEECFDQVLDTAAAIADPFEQAIFVMVHLPYLQPFEDVNKRLARLAANMPFIRHNLCPLSFVDVPKPLFISAMLGVYDLNRVELLRDLFAWAYQRSCARYSAVRQSLGDPDLFRLQHRQLIMQTVAEVVRAGLDKAQAAAAVRNCANRELPAAQRDRFVEVTETQLMALHLGNVARFRLRPSEFQAWHSQWA